MEKKLYEALRALAITARTFRNVPKDEQEWLDTDDAALDQAFQMLTEYEIGNSPA
jgi:hypothetical protein